MQAVGYQARKRSVSRFLSLQIGTEANIFFFSMGSADKSAGGGGGKPFTMNTKLKGPPAVKAVTFLSAFF